MKLLLVILINLTGVFAFAQSRGYAGYIRIGSMSVPGAKAALGQIVPGITGFGSGFSGIGGELEYRINRMVLDAEMMVLSQGPANTGDRFAEPFSTDIMFKTGYALLNGRNVVIYPNAGIGIGGVFVTTYQKSGGVKNQLHTIYLMQPVFDLGINSNVIVYRFKKESPTGILPVGIRAGYRFASPSDDWRRMNGSESVRANYQMHGWYLSIALGMGYVTSNKNTRK